MCFFCAVSFPTKARRRVTNCITRRVFTRLGVAGEARCFRQRNAPAIGRFILLQTCAWSLQPNRWAHTEANIEMMRLAIRLVAVVSSGPPHSVSTDQTVRLRVDALAWQGMPCVSGITRIIGLRKPWTCT